MAEFCLKCWNKINDDSLTEKDIMLSADTELCEGCGKDAYIIVSIKRKNFIRRLAEKLRAKA